MISEVIYYFLFFWNKKLACFFNHVLLAARTIWTDCKLQLVGFFLEIYLLYLEERELFCLHILMKFRVCQHICSRKKYGKYTNISVVKWVLFRVNPESVKRICWRQGVSLFQVLFFARFDYFSMFHNTFAARAPIWEIIKYGKNLAKKKKHKPGSINPKPEFVVYPVTASKLVVCLICYYFHASVHPISRGKQTYLLWCHTAS